MTGQDSFASSGTNKSGTWPMMNTVFHADLSDAHPGEDYWVHANGKRHRLVPHTTETLAKLRACSPHLNHIADTHLTHFTEQAASMPADRVLRVHIKHTLKNFPEAKAEHGIHHVAIHVPPKNYLNQNLSSATGTVTPHNTPINWVTTAQSLLFHHPDLINDDTDTSNTIMDYMNNNQDISHLINNLALQMKQMGPPTEASGWATLVPFTPPFNPDNTGKGAGTVFDGTKTYYKHEPSETIQTAAGPAMTAMMKATKNDNTLRGKKWQLQNGISQTPANPQSMSGGNAPPTTLLERNKAARIAVTATGTGDQWNAAISNTDYVSGLMTSITIVDASQRQIQIDLSNQYIRYLGAYIRFFDADGNALSVPTWKPDDGGIVDEILDAMDIQYDDLRFIGVHLTEK